MLNPVTVTDEYLAALLKELKAIREVLEKPREIAGIQAAIPTRAPQIPFQGGKRR